MAVEELLERLGSLVVAVTVAVLLARVEELNMAAFTLIVIRTSPPTPSVPMLQPTVPVAPTAGCVGQVPCVVVTEVKVTAEGKGSETVTPCAVAGPLFVTCRV